MDNKRKNKKSLKKDNKKRNDMACYDVCDPCGGYYVVDDCGCVNYYTDPCCCC